MSVINDQCIAPRSALEGETFYVESNLMIWFVCCLTIVYWLQKFGKVQTEDKVNTNGEEVRFVLFNPQKATLDIRT